MVFKELEIQGFKSFPDKVKISFDTGVTGVVGPNGSGKSNLSDAVRWVLGETSSRQLRAAGKMEDVIFGGTRKRSPMGFAQVRLTLDNTAHTLDVDACLTRMESPAPQQGFFSGWLQDYCTLAQVQHQKHFFFIPQGSINTPQEFTAALQAYAEEKGMQFALTKEGMYPEFSLDGIAYKAYRNPGKYRDEICCDAVHPEQLDAGLPPKREKLLRILRIAVPPVCTFAAIMAAGWLVAGGAGWLWLAVLASAGVLLGRCFEK